MPQETYKLPLGNTNPKFKVDRPTTDAEITVEVAHKIVNTEKKKAEEVENLTKHMKEAMESLDAACNQFRVATMTWLEEELPASLVQLRALRVNLHLELSQLTKQLADLRQFFIGPTYDMELGRLTEFVSVCERLKALKDSGFLDTVADTMIRLADKE